ncbi:TetR/AcrR family transcriptional regulator [Fulvivirga ulvae]|uniref:TetR/AcrR family transcriptional regulator n=1 Tax=Fulvivirga ulvae TaxID=2904245 RepID=UPI001F398260|nr:TetR/AcrR family transcriptional regulator [Fulvivirga ulvae]UII31156.1 TetR/AcrR family transcriptional regulator [Fulvivirga ulvae]
MEKDRILAGCRRLFEKWGVHRVTMDEVSKHLGISKKTLYKVYVNKDAIVSDFVKHLIEESRLELRRRTADSHTEIMRLSIFNWFIIEQALTLGAILFYDIRKYHPAAFNLIKNYKHELTHILNNLLEEGQRAGMFRSEINTMLFAELRINILKWDVMEAKTNVRTIAAKQKQLTDLILHGLQVSHG